MKSRNITLKVNSDLYENYKELCKKTGLLISHKEVLKEISIMDDALKKWAKKQKKFFKELDEKQMEIVRQILKKYPSLAKSDNETAAADPFVIALAVEMKSDPQKTLLQTVKGRIVVTEEKLRGNKVKIPFVCKDYDIECINIVEMYRVEGWKF